MRVPVLATAACLLALAGCEQSYSSTTTTTEAGGEVVERSVEVQIGGERESSAAEKAAPAPAPVDAAGAAGKSAPAR